MTRSRRTAVALAVCLSAAPVAVAQQAGSAAQGQQTAPRTEPGVPVMPPTAELVRQSGNSLLRASLAAPVPIDPNASPGTATLNQISFFAVQPPTPRTLKKHDLVTIIIRQQSQFSSTGNLDAKRENTLDANLQQFIKLSLDNWAIEGLKTPPNPTEIKWDLQREAKNNAAMDRSDSYIDRLGAEVVDVKPNGTVIVQARRHLVNDEEDETIVLSGTCWAEDITADNTILSNQLHDLDLNKQTKGAVRDGTKRGWLTKLLDVINVF